MRRMEKKKKGRKHRKPHHKRAMTIAYYSGPEMAGKCGHMLWKHSNQSRPLWRGGVSAAVKLFPQNCPVNGASHQ